MFIDAFSIKKNLDLFKNTTKMVIYYLFVSKILYFESWLTYLLENLPQMDTRFVVLTRTEN